MSPLIPAVAALVVSLSSGQSQAPQASSAKFLIAGSAPSAVALTASGGFLVPSGAFSGLAFNRPLNPFPQQPQAKSAPPVPKPRPRVPGSMVGYIDNPIVESQIRVRFDADFEDEFPDRAEFVYAKCNCYRLLQGSPALDPNAPGPGPGVATNVNFQQLYLNGEYSPHRRFSGFVEVPIRWLQPQSFLPLPFTPFQNESGLSDVMAGFKFAAVATESTYVTFQFKSYFPSGDASKGLGTSHYTIEPSLLVFHSFTPRLALEGQLGDWHPIGGSAGVPTTSAESFAGDVFFYGVGPSYTVYNGDRLKITPVVELFGWHLLSGFESLVSSASVDGVAQEVSGMNIVNLKVGLRFGFGEHNSVYAGFGQALTHDDWYKHLMRLEYRYTF